jgi:iron(III) transport system ATP-binding protein
MGTLNLEHVTKVFGDVHAVDDVTLTIHDGEFITFLGPSGCGKTTLLRTIAGFVRPTAGKIRLGERVLTSVEDNTFVPPEQRGMGMVFQSYAVWPHMNVFQNVAYPLKFKKLSRADMDAKVRRVLDLVKLQGLEERYAHQLSGGQQQRVALARALVMEPEVLLLDEPLSNLDAKLREEMRDELVEIQRRLHMTIVYVTHDQTEAMAMSDRVVVMRQGRVLQVGSPRDIYESPTTVSVADFVGQANFIPCRVEEVTMDGYRVRLPNQAGTFVVRQSGGGLGVGDECLLMVRPEYVTLNVPETQIVGTVRRKTFLGSRITYDVALGDIILRTESPPTIDLAEGDTVRLMFARAILLKDKAPASP